MKLAAEKPGQLCSSLESCRYRLQAEHGVDLDEEGRMNESKISCELNQRRTAVSERRAEWVGMLSVSSPHFWRPGFD